jgi:hypothetical protein
MTSKGTPRQTIRIQPRVWVLVEDRARRDGTTSSGVVRAALDAYISGPLLQPPAQDEIAGVDQDIYEDDDACSLTCYGWQNENEGEQT